MNSLEEIDAYLAEPDLPEDSHTLTAAELGEWLGLRANRIHALARDGVLPRSPEKRFPLQASVAAYCDHARALAKGKAADKEWQEEKIRLAREQADKISIANAKARGDMVLVADVARAWSDVATDLRAAVLAIPSRVAGRCGLERRAAAALDDEIRLALESISDEA